MVGPPDRRGHHRAATSQGKTGASSTSSQHWRGRWPSPWRTSTHLTIQDFLKELDSVVITPARAGDSILPKCVTGSQLPTQGSPTTPAGKPNGSSYARSCPRGSWLAGACGTFVRHRPNLMVSTQHPSARQEPTVNAFGNNNNNQGCKGGIAGQEGQKGKGGNKG